MPSAIPARFRPISDVALVTGRPLRTIRNWADTGRIDKLHHRGVVHVDLIAAHELSQQAGRRNRKAAA